MDGDQHVFHQLEARGSLLWTMMPSTLDGRLVPFRHVRRNGRSHAGLQLNENDRFIGVFIPRFSARGQFPEHHAQTVHVRLFRMSCMRYEQFRRLPRERTDKFAGGERCRLHERFSPDFGQAKVAHFQQILVLGRTVRFEKEIHRLDIPMENQWIVIVQVVDRLGHLPCERVPIRPIEGNPRTRLMQDVVERTQRHVLENDGVEVRLDTRSENGENMLVSEAVHRADLSIEIRSNACDAVETKDFDHDLLVMR